MTWIKICGVTSLEDASCITQMGADALGFVFAPSKRTVSCKTAKRIIEALPAGIEKIGVFVNEDLLKVQQIIEYCNLTGVQFHGDESPAYCQHFKNLKVIKSFRVNALKGWDVIPSYVNSVDEILLDTYIDGQLGGTGKTFSWDLIEEKSNWGDIPLIVAGGIKAANIMKLLEVVKPHGIDISSGVEEYPGKKDPEKLRKIFSKLRGGNINNEFK